MKAAREQGEIDVSSWLSGMLRALSGGWLTHGETRRHFCSLSPFTSAYNPRSFQRKPVIPRR